MSIFALGCASKLTVTYKTIPTGAGIYEGNTYFGKSPVTLEYKISKEEKKSGKVKTRPIQALWQSGAKSESPTMEYNIKESKGWSYTFRRPDNHPDKQMDVTYGQGHERNQILKRQNQIQQEQLIYQQLQYYNQLNQNREPASATSKKTCTSDYDCSNGDKCAKKENEYEGICVGIYYYK